MYDDISAAAELCANWANAQKMVDQNSSGFYLVFTMILFSANFCVWLFITLIFTIASVSPSDSLGNNMISDSISYSGSLQLNCQRIKKIMV